MYWVTLCFFFAEKVQKRYCRKDYDFYHQHVPEEDLLIRAYEGISGRLLKTTTCLIPLACRA